VTTGRSVDSWAAVIAATYAHWEGYQGFNERDVFGTVEPAAIVKAVDAFCQAQLAACIDGYEFYATSVCGVHGVRLGDGRRIVVKVHRAGADVEHLAAVQEVQRHLAAAGFPAPRPILGPTRLAGGVAVVEEMLDRGGWADAHEPRIRRLVAGALARQIELCKSLVDLPGLKSRALVTRQLWRRPHDRRFDFAATAEGAEWIDRLAVEANRRLDEEGAGEAVVGHNDWRVEHLRFAGDGLSAVWDWDSLSVGAEPASVGSAAHAFVSDWGVDDLSCVPTLEEALAFIADYEAARGEPFGPDECGAAIASLVASMAYSARCEHSDAMTDMGTRPPRCAPPFLPRDGYLGFLAAHGPGLLGVDVHGVPQLDEE
jgi:hypothetical protein